MVLSAHGRVLLTARMDLPPPPLAGDLADDLAALSRQHGADEVVLVGYGEQGAETRAVLERVLVAVGALVREVVLVSDGRWWSLTCSAGCCPPEGTRYDPGSHPLAAEAVYAGLSAQPSRLDLQRGVAGPGEADEARLRALAQVVRRRTGGLERRDAAALMVATVRRCRDDEREPGEADCLLLAVLAADVVVRDVAWAMVSRDDVEDHLRIWCRTVARAPRELALGPLGLLGVTAWIAGQGALQNCCTERLEQLDPAYTLARLLGDISDRALPPRAWDDLVEGMREEVCAVAGLPGLH